MTSGSRWKAVCSPPGIMLVLLLSSLSLSASLASADPLEPMVMQGGDTGQVREITMPSPEEVGPDVLLPSGQLQLSPPDNPQVGDSWTWWLWIHYPMPPHFEQHVCTVRGASERGYVVVRDSDWLVSIDQTDVDAILEAWENSSPGPYPEMGIYEIDSTAFGIPPDELDDDPSIYQVWFDFGIAADGFFFWFDELPEGAVPGYHSNECEVLYLNTTSQGGPGGDYMLAVTAHEMEHMIHWKYDDDETSWVDEGLAELAMWFYGRPDVISGFSSNPDNCLTEWEGSWADYIKTYLWSLYFFERYGGHPAIYATLHEPANSIAGYDNVLDQFGYQADFEDVFADWIVANFLDDITLADGRFGYQGSDLPPFNTAGTFSTYPQTDVYRTVNYWAADYYRFQGLDDYDNLLLSFDGADSNGFAVWGLVLHGGGSIEVHRMPVDPSSQDGALYLAGLTEPGDQVVLAVGSTSSTGVKGYYFSAEAGTGISVDPGPAAPVGLQAFPNPFSGQVTIRIPEDFGSTSVVDIYDVNGRLSRSLVPDALETGGETVIWDGCTGEGTEAAPGIYFAIARDGTGGGILRLILLP